MATNHRSHTCRSGALARYLLSLVTIVTASVGSEVSAQQVLASFSGVTGESTVVGYEGWVLASGFDFEAVSNSDPTIPGGGGLGRVTFSTLNLVREMDSTSHWFAQAFLAEQRFDVVIVDVLEVIDGVSTQTMQLRLGDAWIVGIESGVSDNGAHYEIVRILFSRIEERVGSASFCWDIQLNAQCR